MASHWKGLTLDAIVGATLVLADGRVYEVSAEENRDLLWALRGAGSAFGVVAELKFNTFDAPSNATVFQIALNWNNEQTARNGLTAFRNFAKDTQPAELNMRLFGNAQGTSLEGVYYGSTQQFNNVVQPLLKNAGGTVRSARTMGWLESLNAYANNEKLDATYPYNMVSSLCRRMQTFPLTRPLARQLLRQEPATPRPYRHGTEQLRQVLVNDCADGLRWASVVVPDRHARGEELGRVIRAGRRHLVRTPQQAFPDPVLRPCDGEQRAVS